jgi:hypothetical protein
MIFCWTNRKLFATPSLESDKQPSIASLTFCSRRFSISEMEMIREVVAQCSSLSLTEISRTLCELLDWKRPNSRWIGWHNPRGHVLADVHKTDVCATRS